MPTPPLDAPDAPSFESSLERLETLVEQLEDDDTDLASALAAYEEGVVLARTCLARLEQAELRVQELALE